MSKRSVKLLILLAAMLICVGASYAVISEKKADEATATESEETTLATFQILSIDPADVSRIYWTYSDWIDLELDQKDGIWTCTEDPTADIDEEFVNDNFFKYMKDYQAYKEVEVENLADVGLDEPYATVHVELYDGSEYILEYGDSTTISGYCYMTLDGGETVYIVKRGSKANFGKVLDNFLVTEEEDE